MVVADVFVVYFKVLLSPVASQFSFPWEGDYVITATRLFFGFHNSGTDVFLLFDIFRDP